MGAAAAAAVACWLPCGGAHRTWLSIFGTTRMRLDLRRCFTLSTFGARMLGLLCGRFRQLHTNDVFMPIRFLTGVRKAILPAEGENIAASSSSKAPLAWELLMRRCRFRGLTVIGGKDDLLARFVASGTLPLVADVLTDLQLQA